MRPKPGLNNIVDGIIIDINNIVEQYKKTMDSSFEDYSKQFKKIKKLILGNIKRFYINKIF